MFNKKRLLALTMSTAMIASALAGCSSSSSKEESKASTSTEATKDSAKASEESKEETTTKEEETEPVNEGKTSYALEAGKVVDFEDGKYEFVRMNVQSPLTDDPSILEIADFNGSKALKVTPKGDAAGLIEKIGIDVSSLLGDKVADVAMVRMQIGVEGADGNFYPCTGTVFQKFSDAAGQNWVTYSKNKNPSEFEMSFSAAYDKAEKNVLQIRKDSNSGQNSDTAYGKTGKYSTLYIDNIVFYDADSNPIEVNTSAGFDEPDGFNKADWSNLIKVENQIVIPGFTCSDVKGWDQAPREGSSAIWLNNIHEEEVKIEATDADGNPILDENGKATYVTKKDADGNDVLDEEGNPIYETETKKVGDFDWASIMKPGTVFTFYYTNEDSEDLNHYIWFVFTTADKTLLEKYPNEKFEDGTERRLGWQRLLDGPTAGAEGITYGESTAEEMKPWLFSLNDSHTMAQVTYEQIRDFFVDHLQVDEADLNWEGMNFSLQFESGMKYSVTAVTYALDQDY
jgi:hypothetical protein